MGFFISRKSRGFTLIEVLVVAAIVAILSSVVIMNISDARKKARDTQRVSDLEQLQLALRMYKDVEGVYPLGHDAGTTIGEGGTLDTVLSKYLSGSIHDPLMSSSDYTYEYIYDSDYDDCTVSGVGINKKILYVKTMERQGSGNWDTICGGTSPGTNSYIVILR